MPTAILPQHFDSTMRSCFSSCPQKFYNEYILGLRPSDTSIDLHAGACFSAALEHFYTLYYKQKVDKRTALARTFGFFTDTWGDFIIRKEKHPKTPENMWAAVESYIATYPPESDSVQPYHTGDDASYEFSFAIPLIGDEYPLHPVSGEPFVYVGRFDLLGRMNGQPVVRDEKTAQRLESNWSEKWDLRAQFLGYCWALQQSGIMCTTAVVRGVIITLREVRQVEAIKQYPQFLIDRWHGQMKRDLWRLVGCFKEGYFDYNLGDTCTQYNHCSFMPLCSSPNPANWYSNFVEKRWNPLDQNPVAPTPIGASPSPTANAAQSGSGSTFTLDGVAIPSSTP